MMMIKLFEDSLVLRAPQIPIMPKNDDLTFLGTASAYPSPTRGASAVVLRHLNSGDQWLFDCGEGTQIQAMRSYMVKVGRISRIFISHLHGDHMFGLPGLMCTMALKDDNKTNQRVKSADDRNTIHIYGPHGLRKFLRVTLGLSRSRMQHTYTCHELMLNSDHYPDNWVEYGKVNHDLDPDTDPPIPNEIVGDNIFADESGTWPVCEDSQCRVSVRAVPLKHTIPCVGWIVQEFDQPGVLNPLKATELGIPRGPLLAQLKQGKEVVLPDGRCISPDKVVSPPQPGRRVIILGDTCDTSSLLLPSVEKLTCNPSLIVHEATLEDCMEAEAKEKGHSTPSMAVRLAQELDIVAGGVLVLTHVSQRYHPVVSSTEETSQREPCVSLLLREARTALGNTVASVELPADLETVVVPSLNKKKRTFDLANV